MAENSGIEWTHHTFNPWIGCDHVSPGCDNCYAEAGTNARVSRGKGLPLWGADAHRQVTSAGYWRKPLLWDREAAEAGERHKVFCASLADVFEDFRGDLLVTGSPRPLPRMEALDDVRARLWALIEGTPNLDWLLLTKRPQHVLRMVPLPWVQGPWADG